MKKMNCTGFERIGGTDSTAERRPAASKYDEETTTCGTGLIT